MRNEQMLAATIGCLLAASAMAVPQQNAEPNSAGTATASADGAQERKSERTMSTADAGSTAGSGDDARDSRQDKGAPTATAVPPMLLVLVPASQPTMAQTAMRDGCWAKLYTDEKYGGDVLTLVGPVDMPTMEGPFGANWANQVESVQTGPRAMVTIYDDADYRDRAARIRPGQEIPDLEDEKLGFFEDFRSMQIRCDAPPSST